MKRLHLTFFSLFIFVIFFVIGIGYWLYQNIKPVSSDEKTVRVVISKGKSASEIGNELYKSGVVRSALAFKFYVQFTDKSNSIQAGEFELSPNMSLFQLVEKLSKAPLQLWVTIPEGLRREEIAERFIKGLEIDSSKASQFRTEFLNESATVEGRLFPDTYLFPRDVTGIRVARRLKDVFDQKVTTDLADLFKLSKLSFNEVIVMASIIERETKSKEERPIVTGILLNRLELGMPLQADATAQYAIANIRCLGKIDCEWWKQVTREELETNSPFNTYKVTGLPPGPISNPGLVSIKAVLEPQETDYLYYIHEPNGKIHYARTLEEHNRNVNEYLR